MEPFRSTLLSPVQAAPPILSDCTPNWYDDVPELDTLSISSSASSSCDTSNHYDLPTITISPVTQPKQRPGHRRMTSWASFSPPESPTHLPNSSQHKLNLCLNPKSNYPDRAAKIKTRKALKSPPSFRDLHAILSLEQRLEIPQPLVNCGRKIIDQGMIEVIEGTKQSIRCHYVLFNDAFGYAPISSQTDARDLSYFTLIPLPKMTCRDIFSGPLWIRIDTPSAQLKLHFSIESDWDRFLDHLNQSFLGYSHSTMNNNPSHNNSTPPPLARHHSLSLSIPFLNLFRDS